MNAAFKGPDPKHKPRGEKRYRRKVAGPKQWAAWRAEKLNGRFCALACFEAAEQLHHLVPRSRSGDDCEDNLKGLCAYHHDLVTRNDPAALAALAESLTNEEAAYCERKLGVAWRERLFGAP